MKSIGAFCKRSVLTTISLATLFLAGGRAQAFTFDLIGLRWTQPEITYVITAGNNVSSAVFGEIETAIGDWNAAIDSLPDVGIPHFVPHSGSGKPDLTIQVKGGGGTTLGQTSFKPVNRFSCEIATSKILLSGKAFGIAFSPAGVRNVSRHELGHVLGLGHTGDENDLMYFAADSSDIFGGDDEPISDCDKLGLLEIYAAVETCEIPDSFECTN